MELDGNASKINKDPIIASMLCGLLKNYSDTEYAMDAEFKIDLIDDILAAKEMYIGRYYFDKKKMDTCDK